MHTPSHPDTASELVPRPAAASAPMRSIFGQLGPVLDSDRVDVRPLARIMARLRDPVNGCPWDRQQDFASIAPYTIEEAYEVADAIDRGDMVALKDELGDLLLQVVFHARMAEERRAFALTDVVSAICAKMERRHPHIFAAAHAADSQTVRASWEDIKAAERRQGTDDASAVAGVATALPALLRAEKLQKRAARTGFDWPDTDGVVAKIHEELEEVAHAGSDSERAEEIGDLLFAVVNLARHVDVDPEAALRGANTKFERRFRMMETIADESFAGLPLDAKEKLWSEVKKAETR